MVTAQMVEKNQLVEQHEQHEQHDGGLVMVQMCAGREAAG